MSYVPDSHLKLIKDLERSLQTLKDNLIFTSPVNDISMVYANLGSRNAAHGPLQGLESVQPITHLITDVNDAGSSTGVFDKIFLKSSNVIVDWPTHSSINLKYILKTANDGQRISCLAPKAGKTLTLQAGGNMAIAADIVLTDQDFAFLMWSGLDLGNKYRVLSSVGGGGGGGTLWSNITIDVNKDMLNHDLSGLKNIKFGSAGAIDTSVAMIRNDSSKNLLLSVPTSSYFEFVIGGTAVTQITTAGFIPTFDDAISIGSSSKRVANVFAHVLKWTAGREIDLKTVSDNGIYYYVNSGEKHSFNYITTEKMSIGSTIIFASAVVGSHFEPATTGTNNLGSASKHWQDIFGDAFEISNVAALSASQFDFTLLGYSSSSPPLYAGDTQIRGILEVITHTGGSENPIFASTSTSYCTIHCEGGFIFEGQSSAFRFGIGAPNVSYVGMTWPITIKSGVSYTVDALNGVGTDFFITMLDNTFTRNCTLPDASAYPGRILTIKNLGTKAVFFVTVFGQTVDGNGSGVYTLTGVNNAAIIQSDGSNWFVLGTV
jgi:hypothetical protein